MFSPDGSILAGGSSERGTKWSITGLSAIHLWDVARGEELRQIRAHQGYIGSLSFSPDGKTLVTTGGEPVGRLWDVATGRETLPHEGHRSMVGTLVISPADGTVFTAGQDGTVRRWDPLTGRELGIFAKFVDPVLAMAFSLDGKTLLLSGRSPGLALWSVAERREIRRLSRIQEGNDVRHVGFFWSTAYSPDGNEMITVERQGVRIRDVVSGKEMRWAVRSTIDHDHTALAPDGRILATGTDYTRHRAGKLNVAVHLWELASGQEAARLEGLEEGEGLYDLAYSPDGRFLVACCNRRDRNPRGQMIRIWDVMTGQEVRRFTGDLAPAFSVAFTYDVRSVISGGADGTALVWDVSDLPQTPKAEPLTADGLKARWDELANGDARVAYRATWALSVPSAVPFLREHLSAVPEPPRKETGVTEGPVGPPELLRTLRAIAALERVGTPEAVEAFERLAHGDVAALETREAKSALARLKNRKN
jgi:WD40 repeat protein